VKDSTFEVGHPEDGMQFTIDNTVVMTIVQRGPATYLGLQTTIGALILSLFKTLL
jgi:hypothetical protein